MSEAACARLGEWPALAGAKRVAVYAAVAGEIDPEPFASRIRAAGGIVCYPRVGGDACLSFHESTALRPGPLGIPEPAEDAPQVPIESLDLVVVPGVAFDAAGRRLGQGKGYYDRSLPQARGTTVGLAYDFQVVPEVPHAATDFVLDLVVTDRRVIGSRA